MEATIQGALPRAGKSHALELFVIILGVFMSILDTSVVNIAIPTLETTFNATTDHIQWVLTGYMLTIGVLVPVSGWLTDRFGAKHLFLTALAVFTLGSILCGAAWSADSLIVFRILQALGGGFMMPVAQTMIFKMFPPEKRGLVMGLFGISIMAAPAFGPALSGYLVEYANWRLIFYINVPFGILAFLVGLFAMREIEHQSHIKLDVWGIALSTVGFFSLLYGLNQVPADGWHSPVVFGFVVLGLVCLVLLVIVELLTPHPIIEFRVFRDYMFTMSVIITSLVNTALFAGIFLLPLYLQQVVGLSAIRTGLLMTPAALATAVMMPLSGKLFNRTGARPLGVLGLAIISIATIGFTTLTRTTSIAHIQWLYILRSTGMGLTMMPIMTAGMNTLPRHWLSQGSAVSNTARQVASSLGTALLTSILVERQKFHFAMMSQRVTWYSPQALRLEKIQQLLQAHGLSAGAAHVTALVLYRSLLQAQGFVEGMNDTFLVALGISVTALILTVFFASRKETAIRHGHQAASAGRAAVPAME